LLSLVSVLLFVAVAEGPRHLPFFPLMWIAPPLGVGILVLLVRMHLAEQRVTAGAGGAAPVNPATPPRRILLGSLTSALANPIAALLLFNHVIGNGAKPPLLGTVSLLLALSGAADYCWAFIFF
jgi:hypothetical protein